MSTQEDGWGVITASWLKTFIVLHSVVHMKSDRRSCVKNECRGGPYYIAVTVSQLVFQFIPKVLDAVEVRALCWSVNFFHSKLGKLCLYGAGFVLSKQERDTNCWHKVGGTLLSKIAVRHQISLNWNQARTRKKRAVDCPHTFGHEEKIVLLVCGYAYICRTRLLALKNSWNFSAFINTKKLFQ